MPRERVLVVDDEIDVLDLCQRVLETEGYQVVRATDGWEALNKAREQTFDLLLTDIKMPGLGGLELARAMKEGNANLVCVTMTGFSTMNLAIEALRLGIDEFIVKPFTPDELVSSVSKALSKVRLQRENIRLRALIPLFELSKAFLSTVKEDEILEHVLRIAHQETHAAGALVLLTDPQRGWITARKAVGILADIRIVSPHQGWTLPWEILELNQQVILQGSELLPATTRSMAMEAGIGPLVGLPIVVQNQPAGVLLAAHEAGASPFDTSDVELLSILCGQAGIALSNARLFTEIQRAYEEVKRLDHMKREFINIAAHELRTPLAILMGYASILAEETTGETRERLEIVVRNAVRLRSLIDDMLNLRYLETGEIAFHPETLHIRDITNEVLEELGPLAREKPLQVLVDLPANLPPIISDRQKVLVILTNLLSNAIKFTPAGGTVRIGAQKTPNGELFVEVEDTGIGIPPDSLPHIFEPFYQMEDSLTREHGGIGLGLTIAQEMIRRCGGQIGVESVPGQGSRFYFTLPLEPA